MVEVKRYAPSALLSLQCDIESYLVVIESIVSIIIKNWLSSSLYFGPLACILRFLAYHQEYKKNGVTPERFSFEMPTPLQENYVRKKRSHAKSVEPKQGT